MTEEKRGGKVEEKNSENDGPVLSCPSTAGRVTKWNAKRSCQYLLDNYSYLLLQSEENVSLLNHSEVEPKACNLTLLSKEINLKESM